MENNRIIVDVSQNFRKKKTRKTASNVLVPNSTPMVDLDSKQNSFRVNLERILDFQHQNLQWLRSWRDKSYSLSTMYAMLPPPETCPIGKWFSKIKYTYIHACQQSHHQKIQNITKEITREKLRWIIVTLASVTTKTMEKMMKGTNHIKRWWKQSGVMMTDECSDWRFKVGRERERTKCTLKGRQRVGANRINGQAFWTAIRVEYITRTSALLLFHFL